MSSLWNHGLRKLSCLRSSWEPLLALAVSGLWVGEDYLWLSGDFLGIRTGGTSQTCFEIRSCKFQVTPYHSWLELWRQGDEGLQMFSVLVNLSIKLFIRTSSISAGKISKLKKVRKRHTHKLNVKVIRKEKKETKSWSKASQKFVTPQLSNPWWIPNSVSIRLALP